MTSMVPMEALAINYLTHLVLNVWTWVAFLTAALSFWKIKSSIHSPPQNHHHLSLKLSSPSPQQTSAEPDPDDQQDRPSANPILLTSSSSFCSLENRRSGKFSVYYGQEYYKEDVDDSIIIGRSERRMMGSVRSSVNVEVHEWEALLKMKTAEMGWYRCQDLSVLDGSVVRLWNHRARLLNY